MYFHLLVLVYIYARITKKYKLYKIMKFESSIIVFHEIIKV